MQEKRSKGEITKTETTKRRKGRGDNPTTPGGRAKIKPPKHTRRFVRFRHQIFCSFNGSEERECDVFLFFFVLFCFFTASAETSPEEGAGEEIERDTDHQPPTTNTHARRADFGFRFLFTIRRKTRE
jgi:hypothetical protein